MSNNPVITKAVQAVKPLFWGIDIGGTGIKIGLVDDLGQSIFYDSIPTQEARGPQEAVDRIAKTILDAEDNLGVSESVVAAGLGTPGPMDIPKGLLVEPPQLPTWKGFYIRDAVSQSIGRPVAFQNDANAAAYGEFWLGSGRDDRSMTLLTLGTGVGAGVIVDGELVDGVNSFGGECGHMIVDPSPDARLCAWGGGRGQLEAYASASGVVERTKQKLADGNKSCLDRESISAKGVYEAAIQGDTLSLAIIDETAMWLGIGITSIIHILDSGSVVLGGAMNFGGPECRIGQRFLSKVVEEFRGRTFENVFQGTTISFAQLGPHAGYLGVAGYARKEYMAGNLTTPVI